MPVFVCPDCEMIIPLSRNISSASCIGCGRVFKVSWQKVVNYDGRPIGFVHYKESRTTTTADVYLDRETLDAVMRGAQSSVNKNNGAVVA